MTMQTEPLTPQTEEITKDVTKSGEMPQLSAEMEKRLMDLLPLGLDDWLVEDIKHFLATALEEQRAEFMRSARLCLFDKVYDDVDRQRAYERGVTDVLALLTQKEDK